MKSIYRNNIFFKAPGGSSYAWKENEIKFTVSDSSKYVIKIAASAQSAHQNNTKDDDDLRVCLDGYHFGKYELHDEETSWKGFNAASAWSGASLKGATKIIYFFVELKTGEHTLSFVADHKPVLKEIEVFQLSKNEKFEVEMLRPENQIATSRKGIPWMSFVFLGVKPKHFKIAATVKSAKQRGTHDGDNLKVLINGKVLPNETASTSDKYKNFYFSGDLNKGKSEVLTLDPAQFDFLEDSVDLWYDCEPGVFVQIELFDSVKEWREQSFFEQKVFNFYMNMLITGAYMLKVANLPYSSEFLLHSLKKNPQKLTFKSTSFLSKLIKKDNGYPKIVKILKDQIRSGKLNSEVMLGNERNNLNVNFESPDLVLSIHGVKKIEYKAVQVKPNKYKIQFALFDVYDFSPRDYAFNPIVLPINIADELEAKNLLKNYEVEIQLIEEITL